MNMMESGLNFLVKKLIQHDSIQGKYLTELGESYDVSVVPRQVGRRQNTDEFNLSIEADSIDFILPVECYDDDPVVGDKIIVRNKVYEVCVYGGITTVGAVAWQWCEGGYNIARRVHTKFIGNCE